MDRNVKSGSSSRPRSGTSASGSSFLATLTEADVRRLTGSTAFYWGDSWQRAGHVFDPTADTERLQADVLGSWRRLDQATVFAAGNQLRSECTCHEGQPCRHAAALLLHWLRQPQTFEQPLPQLSMPGDYLDDLAYLGDLDQLDDFEDEELVTSEVQTPTEELARFLESDTMPHLREIARKRGVRVTARNKAELVEQLASILGAPENVDTALRGLSADERVALEAAALVRVGAAAASQAIGNAYQALGGKGKLQAGVPVAVQSLLDLGLLFPINRYATPSPADNVPQAVVLRLAAAGDVGPIGQIFRPRDSGQVLREMNRFAPGGGKQPEAALGMVELFQVIVHELRSGAVGRNAPQLTVEETSGVPAGWRRDLTHHPSSSTGRNSSSQQYTRLLPLPSLLSSHDLNHLNKLSGLPPGAINFALQLLGALGVVTLRVDQDEYGFLIDEERRHEILVLASTDVSTLLANTWLALGSHPELGMAAGAGGPIQFRYLSHPYYYAGLSLPQPPGETLRRVVARVVGRLAVAGSEAWYGFDDLLDLLFAAFPSLLSSPYTAQPYWWFSTRDRPETRLDLALRADWQRLWSPVVGSILAGPMTWLGMLDVAMRKDEVLAFRPRPAATSLVGRRPSDESSRAAPVAFEVHLHADMPRVFVPSAAPRPIIHSLLSSFTALVEASPRGLGYRLSPERLQTLFDGGVSGTKLIELLALHGSERLAQSLTSTVEVWWARYGTVRLYDDLTLLELGDDLLLPELLAASALQDALVHTFSPRLVAVKPSHLDALLAELTRLGYTPRVAEEV